MSSKRQKLVNLKKKMLKDATLPLKKDATNLVFGSGDPEAEIMLIGEGPGYWEDQKGIPFVGNAGLLLNQMLMSIGLDRKKVFITNVIHYRAPNNRDPEDGEIKAFQTYLDEIIEIIKPKLIITLGRFSMAKFIPGVYISKVHGKPEMVRFKKRKILVVPMYHPAAALRNGSVKELLKNDFLNIPEILESYDKEIKSDSAGNKEKQAEQMQLV
jgi:uracil-DNA glycosylase